MNVIDRSPLKTSAQEALWSQSARRMNEAKTAEERASVVQNFAEQLRVEKLRAKRLQENMRELNNAISNPTPGAPVVNVSNSAITRRGISGYQQSAPLTNGAMPPAAKLNVSNMINSSSIEFARQLRGNQQPMNATWTNSFAAQFDLFKNGAGNVNALGSAVKPVGQNLSSGNVANLPVTSPTFNQRRFSENGMPLSNLTKLGPTIMTPSSQSSQSATTPSSRPLNVNAAPFVFQPKMGLFPSSNVPSSQLKLGTELARLGPTVRRVSLSPPLSTHVAVAPKANPMDLRQPISAPQDGRQRSSSIGAQQKPNLGQRSPQGIDLVGEGIAAGAGRGDIIYYQKSKLISPPVGVGQFSQLNKNSDFPKSQYQPDGAPKPKPMGSVKIDLTAGASGGSLLKGEDWDAEYTRSEEKQQESQPKREVQQQRKNIAASYVLPISKDWVSVLKERDDMENRRYNREVMLRLYNSEACKIRPSHLSPKYNNELGLWSPDLWFHVNFQSDQPQSLTNRNKPLNGGRGAVSVDSAQQQDPMIGMRRISCLAAFQQKKEEEQHPTST